ncbi:hypothetical protein AAFF_G00037810 [Aldrovandia affinis]|uniref:Homeobox domain-containing protein n=1 Tax=Aldrovandia affinis TaxID=143900 RepID=A0AAD7T561_9TELE|nr:hypothetical protein AAFF_G00037810 [Aldrovandia affinis]
MLWVIPDRLEVPASSYLWETPHLPAHYDCHSNGYFGYPSFSYYPLDFGLGSFKNGAGPYCQYDYVSEMGNPRKRSRMRTVFTENQTQNLERLFSVTDYPSAEMRDELAVKAGLSAETVRVWFKNRRARRKRQAVCKGNPSAHAKRARRDSPGNHNGFE